MCWYSNFFLLYNFTRKALEKLYQGLPNGGTVIIGVKKPSN